ncbi:MAG: 1-acyl-sn-glycerol-3-phosphate acyltransferase [Legionellaceae bacterium]|nr:1-acyl-sn-glycerol-3-phosphate acyltransferase [Legionellaceae bacterium]
MRTNICRTVWVFFYSALITAETSILAVCKQLCRTINRPWVDRALQHWTSRLLRVARVRYKVINPHAVEPVAGKPTILMCNHSSMYDIPLGYKAFPRHSMRMLAKKELSRIPLLGQAMRDAEFVFIDRKNRRQAMKDLDQARALMESGIIMWISPEGTRSKTGKLLPFKKGAFITAIEANATIIPMGIRGAFNILPPHTVFALNINQEAEIHIGEPVEASDYSLANKEELIERVWRQMRELVGEAPATATSTGADQPLPPLKASGKDGSA